MKIKKDQKLNDEDQPTRFAMITCGEKHSLALAVNGLIWYTGDKKQVGHYISQVPKAKQINDENDVERY